MNTPLALPTSRRLETILDQFATAHIAVIGDLLADTYLTGRTARISREAPVLILKRSGEYLVPGQASNTAVNAASLGAQISLVGAVGGDSLGQRLLESLHNARVDTHAVVVPNGRTMSKLRVLAGGSHTTVQQVIRIDDDEDLDLPPEFRTTLEDKTLKCIGNAGAVVVCDYGYGILDEALWNTILPACRAKGIPVILDSRHGLTRFCGASQITPNEEEGLAVCGISESHPGLDYELIGKTLRDRTRTQSTLLTRGNEGMILFGEDGVQVIRFPVFGNPDCRDVTGAGDTVAAANAVAQAVGASLLEAALLANIAGSIVVQKVGTATATIGELRAALRSEYECWTRTWLSQE